jgi:hypothetical protein
MPLPGMAVAVYRGTVTGPETVSAGHGVPRWLVARLGLLFLFKSQTVLGLVFYMCDRVT